MKQLGKILLLKSFILMIALQASAQTETNNAHAQAALLNTLKKPYRADVLSSITSSYQLVFRKFSNKLVIEMYEATGKPGQKKSIKFNDETGVFQPRPATIVFTSPNATVNLALDENWTINTSSLAADVYTISMNGKKLAEGFIVN